MAKFEFKCPQCGQMIETEESFCGQVAECPYCGKGIVVPKANMNPTHRKRPAIPQRFVLPEKDAPTTPTPAPKRKRGILGRLAIVFCIVLCVAVVVGLSSYGGYLYFGEEPRLSRGIKHYENKAYSKALKLLLPLADKGHPKAQLYVGDCYANGNGVIMDSEVAVKWYRAAADQDLAEAQHRMYRCCLDGIGMEANKGNAAKWCRKAAESGCVEAMFDMGMLYVNGTGVEENAKSAFRWFRKGAERGHTQALYMFGQCYKLGSGVEKDEDEAAKWQNKAVSALRANAKAGGVDSMILLGILYHTGDIVELDKAEAVGWYRRAAEKGDALAQLLLAVCYRKGEGVDEDFEESAKWMLKSAEQGTIRHSWLLTKYGHREILGEDGVKSLAGIAQLSMGCFYQEGKGVEKNMVEAVKWFERAVKRGCSVAKFHLAMCYLNGEGVQKDEDKAVELLEDAAKDNINDADSVLLRIRAERRERATRLAMIKERKANKIDEMREIENGIQERRARINAILKGKLGGYWQGFDASKIASADASVSIKEEPSFETQSGIFSDKDEMEKIDKALSSLEKESARLEARLLKISQVKRAYDAKELESRKETCHPCRGKGLIACTRCKGKGEIAVNENTPCTICDNGSVRKEVDCPKCKGIGMARSICGNCNGKKRVRIRGVGVQFDRYEACSSCNGSGWEYPQLCMRCNGRKKVEVQTKCTRCNGTGTIILDNKESCPVCKGKGNLKCERCAGNGFTYRPKQEHSK